MRGAGLGRPVVDIVAIRGNEAAEIDGDIVLRGLVGGACPERRSPAAVMRAPVVLGGGMASCAAPVVLGGGMASCARSDRVGLPI